MDRSPLLADWMASWLSNLGIQIDLLRSQRHCHPSRFRKIFFQTNVSQLDCIRQTCGWLTCEIFQAICHVCLLHSELVKIQKGKQMCSVLLWTWDLSLLPTHTPWLVGDRKDYLRLIPEKGYITARWPPMHFKWCVLGMQGYCGVLLLEPQTACITIVIIEWAWQQKGPVDFCRACGYTEGLSALWHYCLDEFSKAHLFVWTQLIKASTATAFMFPETAFRAVVLGTAGWFSDKRWGSNCLFSHIGYWEMVKWCNNCWYDWS